MKRSRSLSLVLMGTLALGACGSENVDQNMYTFTSVGECTASGLFSEAECLDLAKSALAQAPRFSSREDCERQFGADACMGDPVQSAAVPAVNGTQIQRHSGSSWMPMMMGFMAGRFMGGGGMMQGSQGLYKNPGQTGGEGRSFRTAGGETVRPDAKGRVGNPSPQLKQSMTHNAKPSMSRAGSGSRGGFFGGSSMSGGGS